MTNKEAIRVLKTYDNILWGGFPMSKVTMLEVEYAIDTAIECMGEAKLKQENGFMLTECCNIPTSLTDNYCPNCGKKIER